MEVLDVSERRACKVIGQPRSTQRYGSKRYDKEKALVRRIHELSTANLRYGYRRIAALLRREGWRVNTKRVQRRQEGLQVKQRQTRKRRTGERECVCSDARRATESSLELRLRDRRERRWQAARLDRIRVEHEPIVCDVDTDNVCLRTVNAGFP